MHEFVNNGKLWLAGALLILGMVVVLPTETQAQEMRVRKSIDMLTAEELENYIHAVKKIQEISTDDPRVQFSYAHMAGLHNYPHLFENACEHWNYRFFAWHRALLFNYEDALRASDPPRTSEVTIPYWNWTVNPSGKRYPVAFENDADAVQAYYKRRIDSALLQTLFNSRRNSTPTNQPVYPWSAIAEIARTTKSEEFLGKESDHGNLENPPHDVMHGFIGGDLSFTSTAANDPIFWSFHAFVDLVWRWRQQLLTADTIQCGDCPLNGMRSDTASSTNGPTVVNDVTDSPVQLGVTYEFVSPTVQATVVETNNQRLSTRLPWHAAKALENPDVLRQFEIKVPTTDEPMLLSNWTTCKFRPPSLTLHWFSCTHPMFLSPKETWSSETAILSAISGSGPTRTRTTWRMLRRLGISKSTWIRSSIPSFRWKRGRTSLSP